MRLLHASSNLPLAENTPSLVLSSLELFRRNHDVRDRLGIKSSPATSLSSFPELVERPASSGAPRKESLEPFPIKGR